MVEQWNFITWFFVITGGLILLFLLLLSLFMGYQYYKINEMIYDESKGLVSGWKEAEYNLSKRIKKL